MSQTESIAMIQGTTWTVTVEVLDTAGDPLVVSSPRGKIRLALRRGAETILDLAPYLTVPAAGVVQVEVPSSITKTIVQECGEVSGQCDILATLASGEDVQVARFKVNLELSPTEMT